MARNLAGMWWVLPINMTWPVFLCLRCHRGMLTTLNFPQDMHPCRRDIPVRGSHGTRILLGWRTSWAPADCDPLGMI